MTRLTIKGPADEADTVVALLRTEYEVRILQGHDVDLEALGDQPVPDVCVVIELLTEMAPISERSFLPVVPTGANAWIDQTLGVPDPRDPSTRSENPSPREPRKPR
jgi:hypothetical protein